MSALGIFKEPMGVNRDGKFLTEIDIRGGTEMVGWVSWMPLVVTMPSIYVPEGKQRLMWEMQGTLAN